MFFQLTVDESRQHYLSDFETALQEGLVERGEREGTWGPFTLPVSEAEHLVGLGQFYIRVYQHHLTRQEMEQLVGDLCERIWGRRDVCNIAAMIGNEPNR